MTKNVFFIFPPFLAIWVLRRVDAFQPLEIDKNILVPVGLTQGSLHLTGICSTLDIQELIPAPPDKGIPATI